MVCFYFLNPASTFYQESFLHIYILLLPLYIMCCFMSICNRVWVVYTQCSSLCVCSSCVHHTLNRSMNINCTGDSNNGLCWFTQSVCYHKSVDYFSLYAVIRSVFCVVVLVKSALKLPKSVHGGSEQAHSQAGVISVQSMSSAVSCLTYDVYSCTYCDICCCWSYTCIFLSGCDAGQPSWMHIWLYITVIQLEDELSVIYKENI